MSRTSPEREVIEKNQSLICEAVVFCADVTWFASRMVEEGFISSQIQTNVVSTLGVSDYNKCSKLLSAVGVQVLTAPQRFHDFLGVLSEQPPLKGTVDVLHHCHEVVSKPKKLKLDKQQSGDSSCSSGSSSPPEVAISIPQSSSDFAIFMAELTEMLEKHPNALTRMKTALKHLVLPFRIRRLARIVRSKDYQEAKTVDRLFELLAPYWNFVDFSLLQTLVKASRCQQAIKKLEEFLSERKQISRFLVLQQVERQLEQTHTQQATTHDVATLHLPQVEGTSSQVLHHRSYEEITARVDTSQLTLRDYDDKAALVSAILKLPRYAMTFEKTGTGSITIHWKISREIVSYIQSVRISNQEMILLAKEKITKIQVGGLFTVNTPSLGYWLRDGALVRNSSDSREEVREMKADGEDEQIRPQSILRTDKSLQEGKVDQPGTLQMVTATGQPLPPFNWEEIVHVTETGLTFIPKVFSSSDSQEEMREVNEDGKDEQTRSQTITVKDKSIREGEVEDPSTQDELIHALLTACERGDAEAVATVLKCGTLPEEWLQVAMEMACESEHSSIINLLLDLQEKPLQEGKMEKTGTLQMEFMKACCNGDLAEVASLLSAGVEVDQRFPEGVTPLMAASAKGHSEVVQLLLTAHANVNAQDQEGTTPLKAASQEGHSEVVQLLLTAHANVNAQDQTGATALYISSQNGHSEVVQCLLAAGANVNTQTQEGVTPLMAASHNGHSEVVQLLLTAHANVNAQNQDHWTPLIYASERGHLATVQLLLQSGANVNAQTKDGGTPLMAASALGHSEVVQLLLTAHANVNAQDQDHWTPLIYASEGGHLATVQLLLQSGANVNAQTKDHWTPLIYASERRHLATVQLLLQSGANVNAQTKEGTTPLMAASKKGHSELVQLLLTAHANVNAQNQDHVTPLIYASERGHLATVQLLLQSGANVNAQTKNGVTALMIASHEGHSEVVRLLLTADANINIRSQKGTTALFYAALEGHCDIVDELIRREADVNIQDEDGLTPLIAATQKHHTKVVRRLLEAKANPNIPQNSTGWTPLFFAAKEGHLDILSLLVDVADIRAVDKENLTALDIAEIHGQVAAYQKLLQYLLQIEEFLPQSKGQESQEKQPSKPENVQPTKDLPSETMVGEEAHKPESVQPTKAITHESEESPSKPEPVTPTKDLPSETVVSEEPYKPESVQHEEVVQSEQYKHDTDSNKSEKLRNSQETMPSTTSESGGSRHTKKISKVLREKVLHASQDIKNLFRRLEESLLVGRTEKARVISESEQPSQHKRIELKPL